MSQDMTPQEAADSLRCSKNYIYQLCQQGQLASYRVGRSVKIRAGEVEKFKNRNTVQPSPRRR